MFIMNKLKEQYLEIITVYNFHKWDYYIITKYENVLILKQKRTTKNENKLSKEG